MCGAGGGSSGRVLVRGIGLLVGFGEGATDDPGAGGDDLEDYAVSLEGVCD